jgi:uncharacterized RDD family membrane protein YckC
MDNILEKQPETDNIRYAGFWVRFAAYLLDSIIIGIPLTIIMGVIFFLMFTTSGSFEVLSDQAAIHGEISTQQIITILMTYALFFVFTIIAMVAYFAGMHASKWQATVGKKLLRLKVTDLNGDRITFWRALGRLLLSQFISSIFYIGYIIAAFTEKKQSLHDLIAGTLVIHENE